MATELLNYPLARVVPVAWAAWVAPGAWVVPAGPVASAAQAVLAAQAIVRRKCLPAEIPGSTIHNIAAARHMEIAQRRTVLAGQLAEIHLPTASLVRGNRLVDRAAILPAIAGVQESATVLAAVQELAIGLVAVQELAIGPAGEERIVWGAGTYRAAEAVAGMLSEGGPGVTTGRAHAPAAAAVRPAWAHEVVVVVVDAEVAVAGVGRSVKREITGALR